MRKLDQFIKKKSQEYDEITRVMHVENKAMMKRRFAFTFIMLVMLAGVSAMMVASAIIIPHIVFNFVMRLP